MHVIPPAMCSKWHSEHRYSPQHIIEGEKGNCRVGHPPLMTTTDPGGLLPPTMMTTDPRDTARSIVVTISLHSWTLAWFLSFFFPHNLSYRYLFYNNNLFNNYLFIINKLIDYSTWPRLYLNFTRDHEQSISDTGVFSSRILTMRQEGQQLELERMHQWSRDWVSTNTQHKPSSLCPARTIVGRSSKFYAM